MIDKILSKLKTHLAATGRLYSYQLGKSFSCGLPCVWLYMKAMDQEHVFFEMLESLANDSNEINWLFEEMFSLLILTHGDSHIFPKLPVTLISTQTPKDIADAEIEIVSNNFELAYTFNKDQLATTLENFKSHKGTMLRIGNKQESIGVMIGSLIIYSARYAGPIEFTDSAEAASKIFDILNQYVDNNRILLYVGAHRLEGHPSVNYEKQPLALLEEFTEQDKDPENLKALSIDPLHMSVRAGLGEQVRFWESRIPFDTIYPGGVNILYLAVGAQLPEMVKLLLKHPDISANFITAHGYTVLGYAAELGDPDVVEILLQAGADIELKDTVVPYSDPVTKAVENGCIDALYVLVSYGAILTNAHFEMLIGLGLHEIDLQNLKDTYLQVQRRHLRISDDQLDLDAATNIQLLHHMVFWSRANECSEDLSFLHVLNDQKKYSGLLAMQWLTKRINERMEYGSFYPAGAIRAYKILKHFNLKYPELKYKGSKELAACFTHYYNKIENWDKLKKFDKQNLDYLIEACFQLAAFGRIPVTEVDGRTAKPLARAIISILERVEELVTKHFGKYVTGNSITDILLKMHSVMAVDSISTIGELFEHIKNKDLSERDLLYLLKGDASIGDHDPISGITKPSPDKKK